MSMENSGVPIRRLEVESQEEILRGKLSKLKVAAVGLSVTTVAAITAAIAIGLNSVKKEDHSFEDKTEVIKNESWSHTTPETTSEILDQLDKKLVLGDVSDEQIERINKMLDEDKAYTEYLKSLNTNPDGGTIETGGPVIGSEKVEDVSDEQIERINNILDEDKAYTEDLKSLNTNPDGGTIETGGPVIGSEKVE